MFMGLLLLIFMVVGAFTVLNMLIGVICEIVLMSLEEIIILLTTADDRELSVE